MFPSSHAIPTYTSLSSPPSSRRAGAALAAHLVWHRHLFAGGLLGAFLSIPALAFSALSDAAVPWQSTVLSAIFSSALAALLFGAVVPVVFAALMSRRTLRPFAPQVSGFVALFLALIYVVLRGGAEAFRFTVGEPLNLGTFEFIGGTFGHLVWPAAVQYAPITLGLGAIALGLSGGIYLLVARPMEGSAPSIPLLLRAAGSGLALVGLVNALMTPGLARQGGLEDTADLSFLASIAARSEAQVETAKEAKRLRTAAPGG